jgi:hypothetical protein
MTPDSPLFNLAAVEQLLERAIREERERCAKIAEGLQNAHPDNIAAALRAEGEHWKETYNITVNNMANEQDALRAENAKLVEEVERLKIADTCLRFNHRDDLAELKSLRAENEKLKRAVEQNYSIKNLEIKRLREALGHIAFASGDQPAAMNMPEADWYRSRFYDCVATASAALQSKGE